MPKFDLGINGSDQGAAEGREAWSGELPPTGSYEGVLKVLSVDVITGAESEYQGKPKLRVGVELRKTDSKKYDGYLAWGNLNLIDPSIPFVNQFLLALTDGSDEQFAKIKTAFYDTKPDLDERKKHITDIGRWHIGSPEGELPIRISLSNKPFYSERTGQTTQQVRIESYLLGEGTVPSGGDDGDVNNIAEEESVEVEVEPEDMDESILDPEDANA
jgi:hypothetical protein